MNGYADDEQPPQLLTSNGGRQPNPMSAAMGNRERGQSTGENFGSDGDYSPVRPDSH